jgi:phosphohistidine phosphatase
VTLILMRHAKSAWGDPEQDDHDRPLNQRGQASAARLGNWLRARGHVPARILCSDAVRTRETCERLALPLEPELRQDLYLAEAETILRIVAAAADRPLLVIGHNPGIAEAAERAVSSPPSHPDFARYPTGATTVIAEDGRVLDFVVPRELGDG